ncbi:hypothetical protein Tco_1342752, partial [Tanacetum coccineum]
YHVCSRLSGHQMGEPELSDQEVEIRDRDCCKMRLLNADERKLHTPAVIICAENKREMCAVKTVAYKQNI